MKRKKYFMLYFAVMLLGFIICVLYYNYKDRDSLDSIMSHISGDAIVYSKNAGVYQESLIVSLELNKDFPAAAEIYYTLDGSNPTKNSKRYKDGIRLELKEQIKRYELKAIIFYNGEYSEIYESDYILCKEIGIKYGIDTVYITADPRDLYDYETGIFAAGKAYQEAKRNGAVGYMPGNYNMRGDEWIRNAFIVMCDSEGNTIINDEVGLAVSGGTSSAFPVKSLKIYTDKKYGSKNEKLIIDLKENNYSYWPNVTEYKSLRFRAGSQDMDKGNIRSAIVSSLANSSNFDGCTESRRCIVYLNEAFYGLFDIQQNYSDSFLARHFNLEESDKIEKIKGSEYMCFEQMKLHELFQKDLNIEENRRELESQVDMDNYLLYYAIEILCGNTDWPGNSFEIWRYTGQRNENNSYTDGRWRFLLYDTDLTFPVEASTVYFEGCKDEQFDAIMQGKNHAENTTFINVMQSTYYRDKFITIICDLLNTSFSSENMIKVINRENNIIESARYDFYDEQYVDQSELHVNQMKQYALRRSQIIMECISRYFGYVEKYEMNLNIPNGVEVRWNNEKFYGGENYFCKYYKGVKLVLDQEAYPGYVFKYWLVNGTPVYTDMLFISDEMTASGSVDIKPVMEREKKACLILAGIHSRGKDDWIKLVNVGTEEMDIGKFYLTDNADNLKKYQLPRIVLKEKESVLIHGNKNRNALGDYICNFSLKEHESLKLSDGERIYDQVFIPKMDNKESYIRYDNSGQWVYYMER